MRCMKVVLPEPVGCVSLGFEIGVVEGMYRPCLRRRSRREFGKPWLCCEYYGVELRLEINL
jgi:hypothetical protein